MKGYENSYTKSGLTLSMTIMNCTNLQCVHSVVVGGFIIQLSWEMFCDVKL